MILTRRGAPPRVPPRWLTRSEQLGMNVLQNDLLFYPSALWSPEVVPEQNDQPCLRSKPIIMKKKKKKHIFNVFFLGSFEDGTCWITTREVRFPPIIIAHFIICWRSWLSRRVSWTHVRGLICPSAGHGRRDFLLFWIFPAKRKFSFWGWGWGRPCGGMSINRQAGRPAYFITE